MSSITNAERLYFERILGMGDGYVLSYTDATFGAFFRRHHIDIHGPKYQTYGTSKAKKMRAFWDLETDRVVAGVLGEMLDAYEANCDIGGYDKNSGVLDRCREVVTRINGIVPVADSGDSKGFMDKEFVLPNVEKLPVEPQVATIIEARLKEAQKAFAADAHLSVIFLCGSVLEGILLGAALKEPTKFNQSLSSPRDRDGKVKGFNEWSLAQFIDTAHSIGLLDLDVKKFSHGLRDFRNYIHPYAQLSQGFTPDEHTARVCFQVLKAALASVAGER